ncbi:hypothetical protein FVA74_07825 [Salinibacterium sp. dk2585]|uniref:hypothetical protein n=1 Tax=unclassified Salinibacterium TaxID=2632331 RepID=UPI0011C25777|nr:MULTISPECIES: hypothetical protein [unclassified Salinibacterium]QEE61494.1 hypothetical protein FVA74_07825 [Salinibacterium sp. dk2585]TXK54171.1 hypothetical protein FVP63_09275 [Salinibacterium sp. dk5596]
MSNTFTLADSLSLDDLHLYLSRASRIEDGAVRLIAGSGVLAVYTGVIFPIGLLDESPTVLGLRTFALHDDSSFDAVVPIRSLVERLVRLQGAERDREAAVTVGVPIQVNTATWAAISPPRGGWRSVAEVDATHLDATARGGIAEVAEAIPTGMGEQLVHRVRSEVWGRGIPGFEYVPAGAAFGAFSLGFLGEPAEGPVGVFETGPWTRLSSPRGHVLVRRRGWTLQR